MAYDDYIKRSDALKSILGLSIYDQIEELEGARTISDNTWADGLYDAYEIIKDEVDSSIVYTAHEVAEILAEVFGDDCACNVNGNDEWLPVYCEFNNTVCPDPGGVACWEQYLKWRKERA